MKRPLCAFLVLLLLVACFPPAGRAAPPPQNALKAAPPQNALRLKAPPPCGQPWCSCGCQDGGVCTCGKKAADFLSYPMGYALAVQQNRPLLLFVGGYLNKGETVKKYGPLGVVCFGNPNQTYYGGSLVIGRPDRKGEIDEVVTLADGTYTPDDVKAWLMSAPKPVPTPMPTRGAPPAFVPAPQFFAPPPMMFRGGSGGGRRGGC